MVGEVARGLSLFGGASSEVRRCVCSVVDESRSSLAARCVSFYQTVCLSVCLLPRGEGGETARVNFACTRAVRASYSDRQTDRLTVW